MSAKEKAALGENAIVFNVQNSGSSYIKGKEGNLNARSSPPNTEGHELGHYFGLKDRYQYFKDMSNIFNHGKIQYKGAYFIHPGPERDFIPMELGKDHPDFKDYIPWDNAYSTDSSTKLTNWQLGVVLGINKEVQLPQVLISRESNSPYNFEFYKKNSLTIQAVPTGDSLDVKIFQSDHNEYLGLKGRGFHWSGYNVSGKYLTSGTLPFTNNSRIPGQTDANKKSTYDTFHPEEYDNQ